MGKVLSNLVRRPIQNWNVENRAQKVISKSKDKPRMAPRHPSTEEMISKFSREHPELLEAQKKKDDTLLSNLDGLVVNPEKFGEIVSSKRPLPKMREGGEDPEFGFLIPDRIPEGRCSIKQALEFITAHNTDSEAHNTSKVASDYKLDVQTTEDILKHFHTLLMQVPRSSHDELQEGTATRFSAKLSGLLDTPLLKATSSKPPHK